jgi:hypothetical protein
VGLWPGKFGNQISRKKGMAWNINSFLNPGPVEYTGLKRHTTDAYPIFNDIFYNRLFEDFLSPWNFRMFDDKEGQLSM